jgi:hypothetical protein
MTHVDEAIRRALSPDDLRAYDALSRDQNLLQQAVGAFQSQNRQLAFAGWLLGFALFAISIFGFWRFALASDIRQMLIWGAVGGMAMMGLGLVKLWFWMEMQKNAVVREIKRLELQISVLLATR